jgi:mono/diheme cytochrome c family protein
VNGNISMGWIRKFGLPLSAGFAMMLGACADAPAGGAATAFAAAETTSEGPGSVERGRLLTVHHGCGDCHGGYADPTSEVWLAGAMLPEQEFQIGPFTTYPRNLTPDNATGLGRFTERQIFNALRYGLRPGETADVEITSTIPGQGNYPAAPKYLAPPMPWPAFRHMADQELMDIAAYLKQGVQPVTNQVQDSGGPPDFWVSEYTVEKIGTYPLPPFPTAREQAAR